jgi:hypothetical protein
MGFLLKKKNRREAEEPREQTKPIRLEWKIWVLYNNSIKKHEQCDFLLLKGSSSSLTKETIKWILLIRLEITGHFW